MRSWNAPELSTGSAEAADFYRDGVAALVAGAGHSEPLLDAAVKVDPSFVLAHAARGVLDVLAGRSFPAMPDGPTTRGERQHVEIVQAAAAKEWPRAVDLRREHLVEFPGDLLIVSLPSLFDAE